MLPARAEGRIIFRPEAHKRERCAPRRSSWSAAAASARARGRKKPVSARRATALVVRELHDRELTKCRALERRAPAIRLEAADTSRPVSHTRKGMRPEARGP